MRRLTTCISRRSFVAGLTALSVYSANRAAGEFSITERPLRAYVGTETTPVDGPANGKGIYVFDVDPPTGELALGRLAAETASPSWITVDPSGNYLYAVNELSDYQGNSGSVSAFAVQKQTGDLRLLNTVSSHGAGPTHISVDASGKFAFVANYYGGSIAAFPIRADGSLASACCMQRDQGSLGSLRAASGPPGSFAVSGHDAPHAHMIQADPENRFVLYTDLGQDRIYIYRFDNLTGQLTPAPTPFISLPAGDGPRHFVFHPNGRWFYSIQEEASTVAFFRYASGRLDHRQTISALPKGFAGTNFCSEIAVSSDGRFLYAVNRLHNSIATFAIGSDGALSHLDDTPTEGDYPNQMVIAPGGRLAYVCNQRSDQITSFRIDQSTGKLAFTGRYQPLGTPMCMAFLTC